MSDKVVLGTVAVLFVLIVLLASCLGYKAGEGEQYEEPTASEPTVEPAPAPAPEPAPAAEQPVCEQLPDTGGPGGV